VAQSERKIFPRMKNKKHKQSTKEEMNKALRLKREKERGSGEKCRATFPASSV